jgi:KUP system potassium uptake protein
MLARAGRPLRRHLRPEVFPLALAALGVVYGDIGTSPLYALRICFEPGGGVPVTPANVLGIVSLIVWSLALVIAVKYVGFVLRADNRGEGGILALVTLVVPRGSGPRWSRILPLGLFGAALLYGDGAITPAISVLSALEGLAVAPPRLGHFVLPLAVGILIVLFAFQRLGTGKVGALFGPVMVLWFATLAVLGARAILAAPEVLEALNPAPAVQFLATHRSVGFFVLGAVFLVVTGGEALYADMGHFGREPIRLAWFGLVMPALAINYLGQGALLLRRPDAVTNPFFHLAPAGVRLALVGLATSATLIASQAVVSGSFSLTSQALQLGYLPRMEVRHSSERLAGQVYVPAVNTLLLLATVALVLGFGSSGGLAGAYGIAVSATMLITTVLVCVCARVRWGWRLVSILPLALGFLTVDLAFFAANLGKLGSGGWVPMVIAGAVFTVMTTWKRGRRLLRQWYDAGRLSLPDFFSELERNPPLRVPGTAVFLGNNPEGVPSTLLHNLKHNHVLHERIVLLHLETEEVPRVSEASRLSFEELGQGLLRIVVHYGFMETPEVPEVLHIAAEQGIDLDPLPTFFLGRETLLITRRPGLAAWRKRLFSFLSRNAQGATRHYAIPPNRVIEIGAQVEL